jgi:hypothetical protein
MRKTGAENRIELSVRALQRPLLSLGQARAQQRTSNGTMFGDQQHSQGA